MKAKICAVLLLAAVLAPLGAHAATAESFVGAASAGSKTLAVSWTHVLSQPAASETVVAGGVTVNLTCVKIVGSTTLSTTFLASGLGSDAKTYYIQVFIPAALAVGVSQEFGYANSSSAPTVDCGASNVTTTPLTGGFRYTAA